MDHITLFIGLTGVAVLLQACVLLGIFLTLRQVSARAEALANEVREKVLPVAQQVQTILAEIRPKIETIAESVSETTSTVRSQVMRVDAAVNDTVDRARLQIIRADELLGRTLDRVEHTSDMVHKTVISPVRQFSGLMQGITVGLEFLFGGRGRKNGGGRGERRPVPQDEMFI
jgi:methyl-accepting chemotaxis protein